MSIFTEKVRGLKQSLPRGFSRHDFLADFQAGLELALHHFQRGVGHVEGGVLLGVGGRDDRHHVEPVRHVVARVPHREPQPEILGFLKILFRLKTIRSRAREERHLEQDGLGPLPLEEHEEELLQQRAGRRRGVELAHPG